MTYEEAIFARWLLEQKLFKDFAPMRSKEQNFNIPTDRKEYIVSTIQQKISKIEERTL